MLIKIVQGQRWRFHNRDLHFIMEVKNLIDRSTAMAVVCQHISDNISNIYQIGFSYPIYCLNNMLEDNSSPYEYLCGQDKSI